MPDYLAVGFHLIPIVRNKEENKLMGLFDFFSFLSTSAGATTLTLYEHTLAASAGSFSCFGAVVKSFSARLLIDEMHESFEEKAGVILEVRVSSVRGVGFNPVRVTRLSGNTTGYQNTMALPSSRVNNQVYFKFTHATARIVDPF